MTESKTVADLEEVVRDLIVVMRDLDEPDFGITWDYDLPAEAAEALKDYQRSKSERKAAECRYNQDAERAALALGRAKLSSREAAQLMGLSYQRVQQLRNKAGR